MSIYYNYEKRDPNTCEYRVYEEIYDINFCTGSKPCENKLPFSKRINIRGKDIDVCGSCEPPKRT